eukprot:2783409-Rhodomonas_salina.2
METHLVWALVGVNFGLQPCLQFLERYNINSFFSPETRPRRARRGESPGSRCGLAAGTSKVSFDRGTPRVGSRSLTCPRGSFPPSSSPPSAFSPLLPGARNRDIQRFNNGFQPLRNVTITISVVPGYPGTGHPGDSHVVCSVAIEAGAPFSTALVVPVVQFYISPHTTIVPMTTIGMRPVVGREA